MLNVTDVYIKAQFLHFNHTLLFRNLKRNHFTDLDRVLMRMECHILASLRILSHPAQALVISERVYFEMKLISCMLFKISYALGCMAADRLMPLAHYYDVDRELHELQHRGELVPTRNEIMGKIGASLLLSYSGRVVSYVTREGLGFVRVLHSRVVVSSCSYIREIASSEAQTLRNVAI